MGWELVWDTHVKQAPTPIPQLLHYSVIATSRFLVLLDEVVSLRRRSEVSPFVPPNTSV